MRPRPTSRPRPRLPLVRLVACGGCSFLLVAAALMWALAPSPPVVPVGPTPSAPARDGGGGGVAPAPPATAVASSGLLGRVRAALAQLTGSPPRRFLVVTSTSCEDIAPPKSWITSPHAAYDVVVFDYSVANTCRKWITPTSQVRLLHRPRTFKWPAVHAFFGGTEAGAAALLQYDYFLITDDDVDFHDDGYGVTRLLDICARAGLHICQPALSERSAANFDITRVTQHEGATELAQRHAKDAYVRLSGFVEQMAPGFSREALMQFLPYFRGLTHAWGIDALW